jgi:hypothetical protein
MTRNIRIALLLVAALVIVGCSGGGPAGPRGAGDILTPEGSSAGSSGRNYSNLYCTFPQRGELQIVWENKSVNEITVNGNTVWTSHQAVQTGSTLVSVDCTADVYLWKTTNRGVRTYVGNTYCQDSSCQY